MGESGNQSKASIDELLPPGVEPENSSAADGGGSSAEGVVEITGDLPEGVVVLPSSDGGFVAVRESVKTVEFGGEEVELRKLTPEEKARKRLFRTIFMAVFGLVFLTLIAVVLIMVNG
jgi:hypothetical protein